MRFIWALVILIAIVLAIAIFWPAALRTMSVPPGQYPIDRKRPSWPSKEIVRPYRPIDSEEPPSFVQDAKVRCGTSKTCPGSLATVNLNL